MGVPTHLTATSMGTRGDFGDKMPQGSSLDNI